MELITKKTTADLGEQGSRAGGGAQESAGFFLVIILVALSGSLNSMYI